MNIVVRVKTETFLFCLNTTALQTANDDYSTKLASGSSTEKNLFNLGWTVDELSRLSKSGRTVLVEIRALVELLGDVSTDVVEFNAARRLSALQDDLITFIKGWYSIM